MLSKEHIKIQIKPISINDNPNLLTCAIMVKNEEQRILVTLESVKNIITSLFVLDTLSTDNTVQLIVDFCNSNNITLYLKEEEFVDFSTSRNVLLDYVNETNIHDFVLLLDCNDELIGDNLLLNFCNEFKLYEDYSGFLIRQEWLCDNNTSISYFNTRLIKLNKNWRYYGVVHEYLSDKSSSKPSNPILQIPQEVYLFQNRMLDDDKTLKRFHRDKEILTREYEKNPNDERTVFYLAQTLSCLKDYHESFYYYNKRSRMGGYKEEVYESYFKMGDIANMFLESTFDYSWQKVLHYLIAAYETIPRVEPLLMIGDYYAKRQSWEVALLYSTRACELDFPIKCMLFVNKNAYDYHRYHLHYIVLSNCNKIREAYEVCQKLVTTFNKQEDATNLETLKSKLGMNTINI